MTKILLVEDEANVCKPLAEYLRKEGFVTIEANSIFGAELKMADSPDLVLLDWMLPDGQGIELLKKWRRNGILTPTILLTAKADLIDKVLGLELGANDYVTKPFEPRELVARIRVQLRQVEMLQTPNKIPPENVITVGGICLNAANHEASFLNNPLDLTKTEFELLRLFVENPNQVFSREELLKRVWGYDQFPTTRTVDTHILQLRQKTRPDFFETVHGIGYRFREIKK